MNPGFRSLSLLLWHHNVFDNFTWTGKLSALIAFYIHVYLNTYFIISGLTNLPSPVPWTRRKLSFSKFFVRGNTDDVWNELMTSVTIDSLLNPENENPSGAQHHDKSWVQISFSYSKMVYLTESCVLGKFIYISVGKTSRSFLLSRERISFLHLVRWHLLLL